MEGSRAAFDAGSIVEGSGARRRTSTTATSKSPVCRCWTTSALMKQVVTAKDTTCWPRQLAVEDNTTEAALSRTNLQHPRWPGKSVRLADRPVSAQLARL